MKKDVWTKHKLPEEEQETQVRGRIWTPNQYEYRMRRVDDPERDRTREILGVVWPVTHEAPPKNRARLLVGILVGVWVGILMGFGAGFGIAAWIHYSLHWI